MKSDLFRVRHKDGSMSERIQSKIYIEKTRRTMRLYSVIFSSHKFSSHKFYGNMTENKNRLDF